MKILFIYTIINVPVGYLLKYPAMQYGIASISALLKKHGHECDLLLVTEQTYLNDVDNKINRFAPDIIAYTSVSTQFPYIKRLSRHIRVAFPNLFQICGGPHATLASEEALISADFDAVCVGEGEYPMLELVEKISGEKDYTKIKNLYFIKDNGRILKNELRPFNEDLDSLPFFDRALFENYVDMDRYPHSVLTTRGCYFNCNYCCNHAFKKIAAGKYVRSRSADNIISEIEELKNKIPTLKYLYIEDETIGLNHKLLDELLPGLKETGLQFGSNYRIGVAKLDFMDKLREANFVKINIGVESGNEWIRRNVLNRRYTNEEIINTYQQAKKLGFRTRSYNLIGLPFETPEMFEDTIEINRIVRPDETTLSIFYPYPQTTLAKMCDELGLIPKDDTGPIKERAQCILDLPYFSKEKIMSYFNAWNDLIKVPSGGKAQLSISAFLNSRRFPDRPAYRSAKSNRNDILEYRSEFNLAFPSSEAPVPKWRFCWEGGWPPKGRVLLLATAPEKMVAATIDELPQLPATVMAKQSFVFKDRALEGASIIRYQDCTITPGLFNNPGIANKLKKVKADICLTLLNNNSGEGFEGVMEFILKLGIKDVWVRTLSGDYYKLENITLKPHFESTSDDMSNQNTANNKHAEVKNIIENEKLTVRR